LSVITVLRLRSG